VNDSLKRQFCIHYILDDKLAYKLYEYHAPLPGDKIRCGGEGNEEFYTVGRRVFIYDEPDNPATRINIEIIKAT
jgi:hypothetical protein